MAIRIRKVSDVKGKVKGRLVALCAAQHKAKKGDLYLNDTVHHALYKKFRKDMQEESHTEWQQL